MLSGEREAMPSVARQWAHALTECGFDTLVHVPDSLLAGVLEAACELPDLEVWTANNEGEALALALGLELAGGAPAVLLQNSGIGNLVNPLACLAIPLQRPVLLLIGWRGQPGFSDEPQHQVMGEATVGLLEQLGVVVQLVGPSGPEPRDLLKQARDVLATGRCCALLFAQDALQPARRTAARAGPGLSRRRALETVLAGTPARASVIATTGYTSRQLFALGDRGQQLYVVGGMGCAASLALGVASRSRAPVLLLDGDGAALMRLEAWVSVGRHRPENFVHVLLDNGMHESTGGQPTLASSVDFVALARAVGYPSACAVRTGDQLAEALADALNSPGPHLLHVAISPGTPAQLPRPTESPAAVASRFAQYLAEVRNG